MCMIRLRWIGWASRRKRSVRGRASLLCAVVRLLPAVYGNLFDFLVCFLSSARAVTVKLMKLQVQDHPTIPSSNRTPFLVCHDLTLSFRLSGRSQLLCRMFIRFAIFFLVPIIYPFFPTTFSALPFFFTHVLFSSFLMFSPRLLHSITKHCSIFYYIIATSVNIP